MIDGNHIFKFPWDHKVFHQIKATEKKKDWSINM
jgi:hypothetical protein